MRTIDAVSRWQLQNLSPIITSEGFQEWACHVDLILMREIGLTRDQLPDCLYRDWFDAGMTAQAACAETLSNINIFKGVIHAIIRND